MTEPNKYLDKSERDALRALPPVLDRECEWAWQVLDACDTLERERDLARHNGAVMTKLGDNLRQHIAALEKALRLTKLALSAHGPCRNNSCSECRRAFDAVCAALEGKQPLDISGVLDDLEYEDDSYER